MSFRAILTLINVWLKQSFDKIIPPIVTLFVNYTQILLFFFTLFCGYYIFYDYLRTSKLTILQKKVTIHIKQGVGRWYNEKRFTKIIGEISHVSHLRCRDSKCLTECKSKCELKDNINVQVKKTQKMEKEPWSKINDSQGVFPSEENEGQT